MSIPLQITFHDVEPSPAVETKIRARVAKLETQFERITRCRVVVEAPHRHHHKGNLYNVRIDVSVPGAEIVVNREPGQNEARSNLHVAVRDAFDALSRRLEDHARRQRGDVKRHAAPTHGHVVRVFPLDGYGFLESSDGLEVYFHENALVGTRLDAVVPGLQVRFSMADGEGAKGPQASTVEPIGAHHPVP